jgi:hypothetical protein
MFPESNNTGFARNIRVVEWLKSDLLTSVANLYKAMLRGSEEKLLDALSGIIITCYILGRRLGLSYSRLDMRVEAKLRQGIDEDHEVEKWYKDLSHLLTHLTDKKR